MQPIDPVASNNRTALSRNRETHGPKQEEEHVQLKFMLRKSAIFGIFRCIILYSEIFPEPQ